MSEVKRYDVADYGSGMDQRSDGAWVYGDDFDAEHALRLAAERQVGELRELLARAIYRSWYAAPGYVPWVERGNSDMQEKARDEARAQINSTSTEGKDHE